MSYMLFGCSPVSVFTNAFSFLNFMEVPLDPKDRTGSQEALYSSVLLWGRGGFDNCLTAGMECWTSEGGIVRLATLTRDHSSYSHFQCLSRDPVLSRRFFLGSRAHLQGGPVPWTIHGPGPDASHQVASQRMAGEWVKIPSFSLPRGLK